MDRLICGDVGYGKTEIAVRAAFKAIQDGKQVAMLVPTTLLVSQHMETFQERFAGFPVHLRALSRFQTDKESRETIAGMLDGTVDVVIGTHRLLTESIVFKDLGLVIIDEEQRFGVEHKDALKKLKVHEIIGHGVTLASERLAELNRLFGEAVKRTTAQDALDRLSRVYWFTIEFGALREGESVKAYGTGLLSSAGEMEEMRDAELRPLDLEAASRQQYDPTHFQPVLFCAESFEAMYQTLREYLISW